MDNYFGHLCHDTVIGNRDFRNHDNVFWHDRLLHVWNLGHDFECDILDCHYDCEYDVRDLHHDRVNENRDVRYDCEYGIRDFSHDQVFYRDTDKYFTNVDLDWDHYPELRLAGTWRDVRVAGL
jgi:hypothetical protein